jgi:hypothetical protein
MNEDDKEVFDKAKPFIVGRPFDGLDRSAMNEDEKEVFDKAKPFIVGIVALLFKAFDPGALPATCFNRAEDFVREFEERNK